MKFEIVTEPIIKRLEKRIQECEESILLVSPYITKEGLEFILKSSNIFNIKNKVLVTDVSLENIFGRAFDLDAIILLANT